MFKMHLFELHLFLLKHASCGLLNGQLLACIYLFHCVIIIISHSFGTLLQHTQTKRLPHGSFRSALQLIPLSLIHI